VRRLLGLEDVLSMGVAERITARVVSADASGRKDADPVALATIDVSFYRDDYDQRGLHRNPKRSEIPFEVEGRDLVLVDDVLYTGRTIRAALNAMRARLELSCSASSVAARASSPGSSGKPSSAVWASCGPASCCPGGRPPLGGPG